MKNNQEGFISCGILSIVVIVLVGGGLSYYLFSKDTSSVSEIIQPSSLNEELISENDGVSVDSESNNKNIVNEIKTNSSESNINYLADGFHYGIIKGFVSDLNTGTHAILFDKVEHDGVKFGSFSNQNPLVRKLELLSSANFRLYQSNYGSLSMTYDNVYSLQEAQERNHNKNPEFVYPSDTQPSMPRVTLVYVVNGKVTDIFYNAFNDGEVIGYGSGHVMLIDAFKINQKYFAVVAYAYPDPNGGYQTQDEFFVFEFDSAAKIEGFRFDDLEQLSSVREVYSPNQYVDYLREIERTDEENIKNGKYIIRHYLSDFFKVYLINNKIIDKLERVD